MKNLFSGLGRVGTIRITITMYNLSNILVDKLLVQKLRYNLKKTRKGNEIFKREELLSFSQTSDNENILFLIFLKF